jgi:hypothetical protein
MGYNSGVRISDEELNRAITRIAASNQISADQYLQQIVAQGSSVSALKEEIRNEMTIMRVQQGSVMRRIRISQQELDNFLNSEEGRFLGSPDVNIGHILLSIPSGSSQEFIDEVVSRAQLLLTLEHLPLPIHQINQLCRAVISAGARWLSFQGCSLKPLKSWKQMLCHNRFAVQRVIT